MKKFKLSNIKLICLFVYLFICLFPKNVLGQTTQSFTLSPPTLKFTLDPGEKVEKSIKITNNTNSDAVFYANIQNFVVTDKNGTPELLPHDAIVDNKYAASSWAAVLPDAISVPAGTTTTTTLYLQIPSNASPGGKYISVAFMPKAAGLEEGTGASVNAVAATLVYLTINGPTEESGRITSFAAPGFSEYGPVDFKAEVKNTGDIHINPKLSLKIKNIFGREVYSSALPSHLNVFPGTIRTYETAWSRKWLLGRYKADLSGFFGKDNNLPLSAVVTFWVIPYKIILAVVAVAVLAVILANKIKNKPPEEIKEEEK
jgi:hypothetical protein